MITARHVLAVLLVAAAAPARAQDFPPERPPGAIVRHQPKPARPCEVELSLLGKRRGDDAMLVARVKNRAKRPLTIVLPDACGGGPVTWLGVRDGYDFYGRCNVGACVKGPGQMRLTLKPGESRPLSNIVIALKGNSCNAAVPPGEHPIAFYLPFQEGPPEVCGNPGWKLVVAGPQAPKVVTPVQTPPSKNRPPGTRCPNIPCGLYCPYGYGQDENGCGNCTCLDDPFNAPQRR